ncbi:SIMPL domain-containing protein [Actinocorallia longicatena]|uniref:SIMPL domain-containing protein n=1 Tax=Actinocorallia longicatena TaxID=111803 RepID=A0ABP6QE36_9ACTN
MRGRTLTVAAAASLALLTGGPAHALASLQAHAPSQAEHDTVSVDGEGSVTVTPNIMNLNAGVELRRATVGEAYDAAGEAATEIIDVLTAQGVARKDIATAELSVQPEYVKDGYPRIEGYRASEGVHAVVRDLKKASEVLKAVAKTGDDVRIDSISFDKDDWSEETAAAQTIAFRAAEARARRLAKLGHRRLGRLLEASMRTVDPIPAHSIAAPKAAITADAVKIEPGEGVSRVTVHLVYALA